MMRWGIEMEGAGPRLGGSPILAAAQRGRGNQHAMRGSQHGLRERPRGIEPVPVEPDIDLAAFDPVDGQPVDKIWVGWPTKP